MIPIETISQWRSVRAATAAPRVGHARSLQGSSWQEHEKVETPATARRRSRCGDAGNRQRAMRTCGDDPSDRFVLRRVSSAAIGIEHRFPQSSGAERKALDSLALTGAPRLPQDVRM